MCGTTSAAQKSHIASVLLFNLNLFHRPDVQFSMAKRASRPRYVLEKIYTFTLNIQVICVLFCPLKAKPFHNRNAHSRLSKRKENFYAKASIKHSERSKKATNFIMFGISCFLCFFITFSSFAFMLLVCVRIF